MIARQLFLLSPYRPPTSYPVSLSADEAAAWLNGYAALWHPLALRGAMLPPLPASAYDHNDPAAGAIYALPGGPSLYLAEDWRTRAAAAGAVAFDATVDRAGTFAALIEALKTDDEIKPISQEIVRLFSGLGFGYLMLDTLFDASNHDRLLDLEGFWKDVQAAAEIACGNESSIDAVRPKLSEAAAKLQAAREGLNPGGVALVNLLVRTEETLAEPWPCTFSESRPVTLIAASQTLSKLASEQPAIFDKLKGAVPGGVDLAVGVAAERDDSLLPIESQIWSYRKAREDVQSLFGAPPRLFGRTRSEYHPQLPSWLSAAGFDGMIALNLDGATLPSRYTSVIQWPGPDGKSINAFTRDPLAAHEPITFFNLAYHLHEATSRESAPVFALVHTKPAAVGYDDLLAISELANVFGEWHGLNQLLRDSHSAEYISVPGADEFFVDTLEERVTRRKLDDPVSRFAVHARQRRILDSAFVLAGIHRSLTPPGEEENALLRELEEAEDYFEKQGVLEINSEIELPGDLEKGNYLKHLETKIAMRLADRLLARSEPKPGWLILNSCGSLRRVGLELEAASPIPVDGPVKASEFENGKVKVVVEVPGLGFAWIPRGVPGTVLPKPRIKTAEGTIVRNEFLEAEIDPASGGIKSIRDNKTGMTRFGQILAWHAGSRMVAKSVSVTHCGSVLGEITATGELRDGDKVLAQFTQRIRAWIGRPALELRIEITPVVKPSGYPWQNFFGCRFAWRDDRATLFRGVNGVSSLTTSQRPQSPDYLEIRLGKERSFIFTGGLPFLQRHGGRMVDVVLIPAGETATTFDLMIAFDRDFPMPTAQSWLASPPVIAVEKGPPPIGASGWLANFDLPSLLLTSLRPASPGEGMSRAVLARFVETAGFAASTEMRFARDPSKVAMVDLNGETTLPIALNGDAIPLDCSANELFTAKIEWA